MAIINEKMTAWLPCYRGWSTGELIPETVIGSRVSPFAFTAQSKSELGSNGLTAINSGWLKMYAGDGSDEYQEFWFEMERAKSWYRPSQTMNFYVDPAEGRGGRGVI